MPTCNWTIFKCSPHSSVSSKSKKIGNIYWFNILKKRIAVIVVNNDREYQSGKLATSGYTRRRQTKQKHNWQHPVHKTNTNKTKTQHNMCWTPQYANKYK